MAGLRLLCPEPQNYSQQGLAAAAELGDLVAEDMSQAEFTRRAAESAVVMVRVQHTVRADLIANAPHLKAILSPTTGRDHIDLAAAEARGIQVFTLFGADDFLQTIYSSAEHSFTLLLALIRHIPAASNAVLQNQWIQRPFRGHELDGKRIGILGYGRIGSKVARYAHGFGMQVWAYDPYVTDFADYVQPVASLDELLAASEIFMVHVPLNAETEGLIGHEELAKLSRGAFLVNTARGAVLDEAALIAHLASGHLAGAALDVITHEDRIAGEGHPLIDYAREHDNLLITPHIGGTAEEAIEKTDLFVIANFKQWWTDRS